MARSLLSLLLLLVVLLPASPLRAQESEPPGEAQLLLEEARLRFARSGDAVRALELFRRSYLIEPTWQAQNGIALMHEVQGDLLDAFAAYQRLLAEFGGELDDEQRGRIQRRVDRLAAQTGVVVIDAAQAGVTVSLDGKELGVAPLRREVRVMPGPHVVIGTLAEHEPRSPRVEVGAGETVPVSLRLTRIGVRVEVEQRREVRPLPVWLPWATLGAGALLAGGGVFAFVDGRRDYADFNRQLHDDLDEQQAQQPRADDPLLTSARNKRHAGMTLCAVGGAVVAGGVLMVLFNRPRLEVIRGLPAVELGPRSVALRFELELF